VFDKEIAYFLWGFAGLVKQLSHAGSHVNRSVRIFIEPFSKFIDTPFQTGQMTTDKNQVGIFIQHPVAGSHLFFIRWKFGMQEHMVLRVFSKIVAVVFGGHFVKRQPAVFRFAQMANQRNSFFDKMLKNGIKFRVVNHD